ncbi:MAG: VOC family protein [Chitinophagaceae bacterium]|nr:VOC family protein [Chitinophagaceae bacterium]
MQNIDIYLHFNGNSEQAFSFYRSVFGGEFIAAQRYRDMPGGDKMKAEDQEKMMHIAMNITPHTTLMGTDMLLKKDDDLKVGNNFHICIQAEDEKEANKLFQALSEDGKIEMPMNKTFWGAYFGMCQDKFGLFWMINFTFTQTQKI